MPKSVVVFALMFFLPFAAEFQTWGQGVPENPTDSDLKSLLAQASKGIVDPNGVVALLSKSDGRFVVSMRELLFQMRSDADSVLTVSGESGRPSHVPWPAHRILIAALEAVGSLDCYTCVYDAVVKHPDPEIRGLFLNSLANAFQPKAKAGHFIPDKQLIRLFVDQAGDTTSVHDLGKRVGDVAREGMRNWTAKGGSRPITVTLRPRSDTKSTSSFVEHWWSRRSPNIRWDPVAGLFVLPH